MVATSDLGSDAERRGGSSPFIRTEKRAVRKTALFLCGYSATILIFPPTSLWEREAINLTCDFQGIRLFCCFGQMQALAPATKKDLVCDPSPQRVQIRSIVDGCGNKRYLFSKVFPLHLRFAWRSSPFIRNYIFARLMCLKPVLADAGVGDEGNAQRGDALH